MVTNYDQVELDKLAEAAGSDVHKFEQLYRVMLPQIYGYILKRVSFQKELAEDICSEVFMNLVTQIKHYHSEGRGFRAYIFKIAYFKLMDHYRGGKRQEISLDERVKILAEANTELEAEKATRIAGVLACLDDLIPPQYKQVLELKYLAELELEEMSEIMEQSKEQVYVLVSRAQKKLLIKVQEKNI